MTNLALSPDEVRRIEAALGGQPLRQVQPDTPIRPALQGAEVAFLSGRLCAEDLLGHPRLQWVHVDSSGLDHLARPELVETGPRVTGAAGRSAPVLAEHALMFMLALGADLPRAVEAQRHRQWIGATMPRRRGLYGQTAGIIGLGATGRALARRCRALGMRVAGYNRSRRHEDLVDAFHCAQDGDELRPFLETCDFLVLCAPLTDETRSMIGAGQLAMMKPGAVLVNIARGGLVQEEALVSALASGHLGGAGLDVFLQEPLPPDHPLWTTPNTIITPHCTAAMPGGRETSLSIIEDNIARFLSGAPLRNELRPHHVLTDRATA